jgi:hypothetical protein
MMKRTDAIAYCQREAARLHSMLARTTTPAIKTRLFDRIEELERIANGEAAEPADFELTIIKSRW